VGEKLQRNGVCRKKGKRSGIEPSLRTLENIERLRPLLSEVLRLRECVDNKGRHLTDTIFRK
jgi:hypothetical protein